MSFSPATADQQLALAANAGIFDLDAPSPAETLTEDLVQSIVEGGGAFASGWFAPLNVAGDHRGARLDGAAVRLPEGFADAYRAFVEQGWNAVTGDVEMGGQGLPSSIAASVIENLGTANMAFTLLPILTHGAIEAIEQHGSADQKRSYLPRLLSGEWTGTMNLTEPQAGSDLGNIRTTAVPAEEGAGLYRIKGTKIFITWGEHDLSANIVHLVLARIEGAPEGSQGLSLFLVPKFRLASDGTPGPRNDLRCVGLEKKLGIHASPTCVMAFGDEDECIGELIGVENKGLRAMFTMMNSARIHVGNQGVQIAERAAQQAARYATERIQSPRASADARSAVPIADHPDVRRMLLRMRALTDGARALLYYTTGMVDRARRGDAAAARRTDLLVPMLKSWATDIGCEVASLGIQVHGGMGYIEETGAAQHYRDARIAPIYEGTNGIQAADLVLRKLGPDYQAELRAMFAEIAGDTAANPNLRALASSCADIAEWMIDGADTDDRLAGSYSFCRMCAVVLAGRELHKQLGNGALSQASPAFVRMKQASVRYFLDHYLPETQGLAAGARAGASLLYMFEAEDLLG